MAPLEDIPQPTRDAVATAACPSFDTTPFVSGLPLAARRVAVVSSAALIKRGDAPFPFGSAEVQFLPDNVPLNDLLISHVSINFDRSGYQRDINTVYPVERLRDLAAQGIVGSVAATHYTVMGSTDPSTMEGSADQISGQLREERVDAVLLTPL